ncbi:thiamine-phosphate pyrophosphorylase [Palleronia aestuarii]|uniref:Thiamine-phosphate synthase n=1 Tax=Palleronia aestuarii TaxID=568105 RepID=A0A2W7N9D1_9RHOB|nr:thiamine phosphate synthase [Palleronia aestuarii]PZX17015.1 thiamine-phosphate pyrophosphorylase [Palleronia aestuarii]
MIPALCYVTDADAPLSLPDQAEAAARGGASWIQLRHKTLPDDAFAALAREIAERIASHGAKLVVNDRVEIARALGAPALHVGQGDGNIGAIRDRIGRDMILGLSVQVVDQIGAIPPGTVDYLGIGPVRATASKPDHAVPIGFEGLARIVSATPLPCLAIGGLAAKDAGAVRRSGCAGMAVVSAISRAPDPERAARAIFAQWRKT